MAMARSQKRRRMVPNPITNSEDGPNEDGPNEDGPNEDADTMNGNHRQEDATGKIKQLTNQSGCASGAGNFQNVKCGQMITNQYITSISSNGNDPAVDADQPLTVQDEIAINVKKIHARLALRLDSSVTPEQMMNIQFYFWKSGAIKESEKMTEFKDIWNKLESRGDIRPQEYTILVEAFEATKMRYHIATIREFQAEMNSASGVYKGWDMRISEVIDTYEDLEKYIKGYTSPMKEGLCKGMVFHNAVFGLINKEGGEIRLANGSFKLRVPREAIDTEVIFSAFRAPPEAIDHPHETKYAYKQESKQDGCTKGDDFVRYSLPYRLGPANMTFKCPVSITIRDFSLSDPTLDKCLQTGGICIYRKDDDNDNWQNTGSCFSEKDNLTSFTVDHFSVYVLGRPVSQPFPNTCHHLPPLNVHILIETPAEGAAFQRAVFMLNENSVIEEYIDRNDFHVECEASIDLDPRLDVVAYHCTEDYQRRMLPEGVLSTNDMKDLGGRYVCLKLKTARATDRGQFTWDWLTLKQGVRTILELPRNQVARRSALEERRVKKSSSIFPRAPMRLSQSSSYARTGAEWIESDDGGDINWFGGTILNDNSARRVTSEVSPKSWADMPPISVGLYNDIQAFTREELGQANVSSKQLNEEPRRENLSLQQQNEELRRENVLSKQKNEHLGWENVSLKKQNEELKRENVSLKQQTETLNRKLTQIHSLSGELEVKAPPMTPYLSSSDIYRNSLSPRFRLPYQDYRAKFSTQHRGSPLPSSPGSDSGSPLLFDQGSRFKVAHLLRDICSSPRSESGYSTTTLMSFSPRLAEFDDNDL